MSFLCDSLRGQKIIFEYKLRHLLAWVRYFKFCYCEHVTLEQFERLFQALVVFSQVLEQATLLAYRSQQMVCGLYWRSYGSFKDFLKPTVLRFVQFHTCYCEHVSLKQFERLFQALIVFLQVLEQATLLAYQGPQMVCGLYWHSYGSFKDHFKPTVLRFLQFHTYYCEHVSLEQFERLFQALIVFLQVLEQAALLAYQGPQMVLGLYWHSYVSFKGYFKPTALIFVQFHICYCEHVSLEQFERLFQALIVFSQVLEQATLLAYQGPQMVLGLYWHSYVGFKGYFKPTALIFVQFHICYCEHVSLEQFERLFQALIVFLQVLEQATSWCTRANKQSAAFIGAVTVVLKIILSLLY